jgi:hypothetical protein
MSHAALESWLPGFFAAFLSAAAKADAHWYSVKSLSEGFPSLAELLGVSNDNLDQLLSLSGFGWIRKGGGLVFLADNFKNFLVMSDTEAFCEHTVFKIRGFSKSQHFIRVGSVNMSKMSKPTVEPLGLDLGYTALGACKRISSIQLLQKQQCLMEAERHKISQATLLLQRMSKTNMSLILLQLLI